MENVHHVLAALRRPIQENRLKREAKRLSDWTGLRLSACQEIAARAFDATSWQALTKDPTFVPDEALPGYKDFSGEQRYVALAKVLSERLSICYSLAYLLATAWQPTAIRPCPALWLSCSETGGDDWKVLHNFGQHPSLPDGAVVVLALEPVAGELDTNYVPSLVGIRVDRLGRFVHKSDIAGLRLPDSVQAVLRKININRGAQHLEPGQLKTLQAAVKKTEDFGFENTESFSKAGPAQLKARWLIESQQDDEVMRRFAQFMPWKQEDYPGIKKGDTWTFWRMQEQQFSVSAMIAGTVFIDVCGVEGDGGPHSQVQVGVGGLRYLSPSSDEGDQVSRPGYYLVKYGNQVRGYAPIPGMDEHLATKVRAATGLGEWEESLMPFFCSDAGLGLAKWAASFPRRARSEGRASSYIGDWFSTVKRRMEYELVRADVLN